MACRERASRLPRPSAAGSTFDSGPSRSLSPYSPLAAGSSIPIRRSATLRPVIPEHPPGIERSAIMDTRPAAQTPSPQRKPSPQQRNPSPRMTPQMRCSLSPRMPPPQRTTSPRMPPPRRTTSPRMPPPRRTPSPRMPPLRRTPSSRMLPPQRTPSPRMTPSPQMPCSPSPSTPPPQRTPSPRMTPPQRTPSPRMTPLHMTPSPQMPCSPSPSMPPPQRTPSPRMTPPQRTPSPRMTPSPQMPCSPSPSMPPPQRTPSPRMTPPQRTPSPQMTPLHLTPSPQMPCTPSPQSTTSSQTKTLTPASCTTPSNLSSVTDALPQNVSFPTEDIAEDQPDCLDTTFDSFVTAGDFSDFEDDDFQDAEGPSRRDTFTIPKEYARTTAGCLPSWGTVVSDGIEVIESIYPNWARVSQCSSPRTAWNYDPEELDRILPRWARGSQSSPRGLPRQVGEDRSPCLDRQERTGVSCTEAQDCSPTLEEEDEDEDEEDEYAEDSSPTVEEQDEYAQDCSPTLEEQDEYAQYEQQDEYEQQQYEQQDEYGRNAMYIPEHFQQDRGYPPSYYLQDLPPIVPFRPTVINEPAPPFHYNVLEFYEPDELDAIDRATVYPQEYVDYFNERVRLGQTDAYPGENLAQWARRKRYEDTEPWDVKEKRVAALIQSYLPKNYKPPSSQPCPPSPPASMITGLQPAYPYSPEMISGLQPASPYSPERPRTRRSPIPGRAAAEPVRRSPPERPPARRSPVASTSRGTTSPSYLSPNQRLFGLSDEACASPAPRSPVGTSPQPSTSADRTVSPAGTSPCAGPSGAAGPSNRSPADQRSHSKLW
ncbi:hypothetical protein GE061_005990 [Apolygus lucorum]|uniref:Uncharacterized protein n=1 Tax=Apolygus lucorum TaxID=248454 RepID=A0A8S9WSH3_APOLU|nr:hypothetical protein GE061_005990 [Apolygus lucorum]